MMNIPKPNPEVYRRAAELIAEMEENYSCIAIDEACWELGANSDMYVVQYEALFGPWKNPVVSIDAYGNPRTEGLYLSSRNHPFWGNIAYWKEDLSEYRQNALLLMAAIVENPY